MPRTTPRSTPLKSSSGMNVALGSGCSPAQPAKVAASSGALAECAAWRSAAECITVLMDSPSVRGAVAPAADKENDSPHATPRTLQRLEALQQQQTRRPRSLTSCARVARGGRPLSSSIHSRVDALNTEPCGLNRAASVMLVR